MPIRKVVMEVRYKDKTGQWQGTHSLSMNEVPKAMTALQKAYEYLLEEGSRERSGPAEDSVSTTGAASSVGDMSSLHSGHSTSASSVMDSSAPPGRPLGRYA